MEVVLDFHCRYYTVRTLYGRSMQMQMQMQFCCYSPNIPFTVDIVLLRL
jgi:hypothetical protein